MHRCQVPWEYIPGAAAFLGGREKRENVLVLVRGGLRPQDLEMACGPLLVAIGGRLLRIYPGDS